MSALSPETEQRLELLFPPDLHERVRAILVDECSETVPGWKMAGLERLHFAVLKLSNGSLEKLQDSVKLANRDVRDVLVWAGFAGGPHTNWLPDRKS